MKKLMMALMVVILIVGIVSSCALAKVIEMGV